MLRYAQVLATQLSETSRANGRFSVEARLARWLAMAHDRGDGDQIAITHDVLAVVLGVRRPGITHALHVFEGNRLIRARRAQIQILDRAGLEEAALGSYGLPEQEYRRLVTRSEVRDDRTEVAFARRSAPVLW